MPKTSAQPATHFDALDGWRGICACFVVLFHFHGYSPLYTSELVRNSYLFVDFFFVLSGFVIAWNYADRLGSWPQVRKFLVLRLGRVYPLHVFMLFCFLAYETARLLGHSGSPTATPPFSAETHPLAVVTNLFLIQSLHIHDSLTWNGPAWSISTEFWTYVIFALVAVTLGLRHWMIWVAAIVPPALLLVLSGTGMDVTFDWGLLRCVFGFALGVFCYRAHRARREQHRRYGAGTMSLLELITVAGVIAFVSLAGKSNWSILAPFVFAFAVLVFAVEGGVISRVLRMRFPKWIGMLSYSIYLTHYFVVMLFPAVVKRLVHEDLWRQMPLPGGGSVTVFGRNDVEGTLFYSAVLVLTVAFSAFTYRWVETPGRDWSRRWARAGRGADEPRQSGQQRVPSP